MASNLSVAATALLLSAFLILFLNLLRLFVWKPFLLRKAFEKQGVRCLPYHFMFGNLREIVNGMTSALATPLPDGSHDLVPRLSPHIHNWKKTYGDFFVFWFGNRPVIYTRNPEWIKEILYKHGNFTKVILRPEILDLFGQSVVTLDGEKWSQHRRIVSPSFYVDKLKLMKPTMMNCITEMLDTWQSQVDTNGKKEIDVHEEFKILTADIISHTAFGSSYQEGKLTFKLQYEQQIFLEKIGRSIYIPGYRFIPTPSNIYWWRLDKKIRQSLEKIIQSRRGHCSGNDLLGMLMSATQNDDIQTGRDEQWTMDDIISECKTFFFAGHETTATLMTWTTMLLATNPEWQERVREEVLSTYGKQPPTYELLPSLRTVGMVLNESLRLYPPAPYLIRQACNQTQFGNISVPPSSTVIIPILDVHHDTQIWGEDALQFNPQRFANGIANACTTSSAYLPFLAGPRNCLGQNFALLEARMILVMMVQRFRFSLSPGYKHAPKVSITIHPDHGMPIIFENL